MTSEPVGSLAEEAARLIAALQGWAQDQRQPAAPTDEPGATGREHDGAHHDPLSIECRFCPLCALARTAKAMTPEVREHLSNAAFSLALAVKGLLDDPKPDQRAATPVEKIDLAED
jgi:hypothetical protein